MSIFDDIADIFKPGPPPAPASTGSFPYGFTPQPPPVKKACCGQATPPAPRDFTPPVEQNKFYPKG